MDIFLHACNLVPEMNYVTLKKLWRKFKGFQYAWEKASFEELKCAGVTELMANRLIKWKQKIDCDMEGAALLKKKITMITWKDETFPEALKNIEAAPFAIYQKGTALNNFRFNQLVAIVGTRVPSNYGQRITTDLAENLAAAGGIVVSGLAYGIDAYAHFGAVKKKKPTVAILASGIEIVTPAAHKGLANQILENGGTLVSEYPSSAVSYKVRYLERNRIISGLAKATIVIEAKEKSGALITAKHATSQNRDLYALCADIDRPQSKGVLRLIEEDYAQPITSVMNVINRLGFEPSSGMIEDEISRNIYLLLKKKRSTETELMGISGLPIGIFNQKITLLEIKNLIRRGSDNKWEISQAR